jgi:SAM-dependent methyltransferase
MSQVQPIAVDLDGLRAAIRAEYAAVASEPERGFHFHTGQRLATILGYPQDWIERLPVGAVLSMAGTGNPLALGEVQPGERVVDCGSGAGADALIAARLVGPTGRVIGVDMTPEMVARAQANAREAGLANVEFREGLLEALPVDDAWADLLISNGVLNLVPDKGAALGEMFRVLRPGGRISITDIVSAKQLSQSIVNDPKLWAS